VPEELFHAAGFTPVFVFHTAQDRGQARAHLPGFTCWVASSALDQALAGDLDGLAAMAFAQTCDTIQGLTDLWRRNVPHVPIFHFGMPTRLDGPAARAYLLAELGDLRRRVESFTGRPISDYALQASIALYNRTRALVRRLYARAADFSPPDLYARVRAAFQMPKEIYNEGSGIRDQGSGAPSLPCSPASLLPRSPAPLLILVGPTLADPVLFEVLTQAGARVAGDLLDLGERYFALDAAAEGDPLESLADRLLALVPTPAKYHSQRSRADCLLALVRERGAHGVLFARQKYCEPHGFDTALMTPALDEAGVPHLLVELDGRSIEHPSQAGQLRTRVEAFVEMIQSQGGLS
jgi:benzoyl-CoA reductase/2-hydroxyglutaryl-CoA dehydratase subunit BcrC/BadD/HgdB